MVAELDLNSIVNPSSPFPCFAPFLLFSLGDWLLWLGGDGEKETGKAREGEGSPFTPWLGH